MRVSSTSACIISTAVLISAVAAQNNTTCIIPPPLQTAWSYVQPPRNNIDFGPPNVQQGKTSNGQPKKPFGFYGGRKIRNLILIIPDGYGPASEAFARDYYQWKNPNKGWNVQLPSDTIRIGTARTRSSDSYVTDSAAAGTAYSAAIKTYNGAISVDENGNPVGTVLEAAHLAGYKTGLVVTSRITHATPAVFASHIYDRDQEDKIAYQLIGNQPINKTVGKQTRGIADIMLGGGLSFFLPNTTAGSLRKDGLNLLTLANASGVNAFSTRAGFDALKEGKLKDGGLPYLGVFTNGHMSYEVDRNATLEPSLLEMTKTALNSLKEATKHSEKGYFIMIEASRIDHAGHSNDLIGHLHEILMYNEVVDYVKKWVDADRTGGTSMISVADHECAGLTLGGIVTTGEYQYNPAPLDAATHSSAFLAAKWAAYNGSDASGFLTSLFEQYGITDANSTEISVAMGYKSKASAMDIHLGQSLTRRALVKWSTLGHTAVDVSILGYGRHTEKLRGNHDNTEVGLFIVNELGLDLPYVAGLLNAKSNEKYLVEEVGRDKVEKGVKSNTTMVKRHAHGHN